MNKILLSGLACSMYLASNAFAVEPPSFTQPTVNEKASKSTSIANTTDPQIVSTVNNSKPKISDAVKAELKEYQAKKKALYEGLSDDAKKVLKKHKKKRPHSRTHTKKEKTDGGVTSKIRNGAIIKPDVVPADPAIPALPQTEPVPPSTGTAPAQN